MAEDELTEFLAHQPTGAVCVVDDDGDLLALPARVVDFDAATVTVDVDGAEPDRNPSRETPACLVADTFTAYHAIRGVIAQGTATWPPTPHHNITMAITRTLTFSFANA